MDLNYVLSLINIEVNFWCEHWGWSYNYLVHIVCAYANYVQIWHDFHRISMI